MDIVLTRDVEALGTLKRLSAPASATAGGSGDSATTTGVTIDRGGWSAGLPMSVDAIIAYEAGLQSGKTLSFGYSIQDSPDGSNFSDYQTATYAVAATGASGGSSPAGEFKISASLTSARRYVRLNFATDLNATGTDTAAARAVGFFAGFSRNPAPNS
jgi:hypothetical protein